MNLQRRAQLITDAIDLVQNARERVKEAIKDIPHIWNHYDAYGEYGFKRLLNEGNPYDSGLEDLITALEEWEEHTNG